MITGESIQIFLDRSDLSWGEEWRVKIDEALASIAFFIPIITPRYFQSEECRRELNSFARKAKQLGVSELVMPILYVDFPAIRADPPPDEAMALAKSYQWEDWTTLRFESLDSSLYRAAVARLANRLASASMTVETVDTSPIERELADEDADDEAPGFIDRVARAEEAMGEWASTADQIQESVHEVGSIVEAAGKRIKAGDARGKGFAARLTVARALAHELEPSADRLQQLGNEFSSQLSDVDSGIRAILDRVPEELQTNPESMEQVLDFVRSMRELATSADEGLGSLATMISAIEPVERDSRNLRPVLRKLRRGLTVLMDSRAITNDWIKLLDDLELQA
ncbi:MAG: TIR domain-containing protein [Pseudonocardiaceae bacterium]